MKLTRRTTVLVAGEETYGVDPETGYQAILTREGTEITPQGDVVVRDTLRDTLTPRGHVIGLKQVDLTIPVELRGAGLVAGELGKPEVDRLLLASGLQSAAGNIITLAEVTGKFVAGEEVSNTTLAAIVGIVIDQTGSTLYVHTLQTPVTIGDTLVGEVSGATGTVASITESLVYRPLSKPEDMGSAVVRYFLDGIRHVVTGVRGSLSVDLTVGQIPKLSFALTGLYQGPTDAVPNGVSYSPVVPRPVFGASVVLGETDLAGISINSINFDLANTVSPDDDVKSDTGRLGFEITGRDPSGSIDPAVAKLATFNPWADWENATPRTIAAGIGKTAGERTRIVMPRAIYREPGYQDRNGRAVYQLGFGATGDNDDEFFLIFS